MEATASGQSRRQNCLAETTGISQSDRVWHIAELGRDRTLMIAESRTIVSECPTMGAASKNFFDCCKKVTSRRPHRTGWMPLLPPRKPDLPAMNRAAASSASSEGKFGGEDRLASDDGSGKQSARLRQIHREAF
jgi:hypothetical protein